MRLLPNASDLGLHLSLESLWSLSVFMTLKIKYVLTVCLFTCRKLLKDHHLDAVTKVAQLEETERRKRLDQQRNNCTTNNHLP